MFAMCVCTSMFCNLLHATVFLMSYSGVYAAFSYHGMLATRFMHLQEVESCAQTIAIFVVVVV